MKKLITLVFALFIAVGMSFGQDNTATTTQSGNTNDIDIDQTITKMSNIDIIQDGDGNRSDITQQYGQYHEALIEQVGDENRAFLTQDNTNTFANIYQEGDRNIMNATLQRSRLFVGPGNVASSLDVDQIGNANVVRVEMDAESPDGQSETNNATIYQEGYRNRTVLSQYRPDFAGVSTNSNNADLSQVGNDNRTNASQDGRGHLINQSVEGNDNVVISEQIGRFQKLVLNTEGDDNVVNSLQDDAANIAYFDFNGDGNRLNMDQIGTNRVGGQVLGNFNTLNIEQNGSGNYIVAPGGAPYLKDGILVEGHNNVVNISQMTDDNTANISITGNGNTENISQ